MSEKIDAAGAFALLERVVAERGRNYIYLLPGDSTVCKYAHGTEPGCGVGAAAVLAGVSPAELAVWDRFGVIEDVPQGLFDRDGVRVLSAFQAKQDSQRPYSTALEAARDALTAAA